MPQLAVCLLLCLWLLQTQAAVLPSRHGTKLFGPALGLESVTFPRIYNEHSKLEISTTKGYDHRISIAFEHQKHQLCFGPNPEQVLAGGAVLSFQKNGSRVHHVLGEDVQCQYTGGVVGSLDSAAAVSTCDGISGLVYDRGRTLLLSSAPGGRLRVTSLPSPAETRRRRRREVPDDAEEQDSTEAPPAVLRGPHRAADAAPWRYLELVLVLDHGVYRRLGSSLDAARRRAVHVANIVHALYKPLGVVVVLVGVEVWTETDEITLVADPDETLTNFVHYRLHRLGQERYNDNAQLLTVMKFEGGVLGNALRGTMCTDKLSGGVSTDRPGEATLSAVTVAHEMGHNFGLEHDTEECACADQRCIMSGTSNAAVAPSLWSDCSRRQMAEAFQQGLDHCLHDRPPPPAGGAVCGNGVMEPGEECDCGLPSNCDTPCCDGATCRLKPGATCATGQCCDVQSCSLLPAGTRCRSAAGECDLSEYCTGETEWCPADVHRLDGLPCAGGRAHCFGGGCDTRDSQCQRLWGSSGAGSVHQCYDQNRNGTAGGDCGANSDHSVFTACEPDDRLCGRLQCAHLNERLEYGSELAALLPVSFVQTASGPLPCRSAVVDLGGRQRDPGLVPQGASCGTGLMCVDQRCVPVSSRTAGQCVGGCSDRGVCNSLGHCHCELGWAPPRCAEPGVGGSVDSGPYLFDESGGWSVSSVLFLVLLVLLLLLLPVVCWCCYRRRRRRPESGPALSCPLNCCKDCHLPAWKLPACRLPDLSAMCSKLRLQRERSPQAAARSVRRAEPALSAADVKVRLLVLSGDEELLQPGPGASARLLQHEAEPPANQTLTRSKDRQRRPLQPQQQQRQQQSRPGGGLLARLRTLLGTAVTPPAASADQKLVCQVKPTVQRGESSVSGVRTPSPAAGTAQRPGGRDGGQKGNATDGKTSGKDKNKTGPTSPPRTTFGMRSSSSVSTSKPATPASAAPTGRTTFGMLPAEKGGRSEGVSSSFSGRPARSAFFSGLTTAAPPADPSGGATGAGTVASSTTPRAGKAAQGSGKTSGDTLKKKPSELLDKSFWGDAFANTVDKKLGGESKGKTEGATADKKLDKRSSATADSKAAKTTEKGLLGKQSKNSESKLEKQNTEADDKKQKASGGKIGVATDKGKTSTSTDKNKSTSTTEKAKSSATTDKNKSGSTADKSKSSSATEKSKPRATTDTNKSEKSGTTSGKAKSGTAGSKAATGASSDKPITPKAPRAELKSVPPADEAVESCPAVPEQGQSEPPRVAIASPASGSALSRVASMFKRPDTAPIASPAATSPTLRPTQSFKAAKMDRDTVRTLGISHPLPADQFSTLPSRGSARSAPMRSISDSGGRPRPASLLVRPSQPPPRPPTADQLYDDCNAGRRGGTTPTENLYWTIEESPEEPRRPFSMVEPGSPEAVYQNAAADAARRLPWRSASAREPTRTTATASAALTQPQTSAAPATSVTAAETGPSSLMSVAKPSWTSSLTRPAVTSTPTKPSSAASSVTAPPSETSSFARPSHVTSPLARGPAATSPLARPSSVASPLARVSSLTSPLARPSSVAAPVARASSLACTVRPVSTLSTVAEHASAGEPSTQKSSSASWAAVKASGSGTAPSLVGAASESTTASTGSVSTTAAATASVAESEPKASSAIPASAPATSVPSQKVASKAPASKTLVSPSSAAKRVPSAVSTAKKSTKPEDTSKSASSPSGSAAGSSARGGGRPTLSSARSDNSVASSASSRSSVSSPSSEDASRRKIGGRTAQSRTATKAGAATKASAKKEPGSTAEPASKAATTGPAAKKAPGAAVKKTGSAASSTSTASAVGGGKRSAEPVAAARKGRSAAAGKTGTAASSGARPPFR